MGNNPKNVHVTPRPDGQWQVVRPNAERASYVTETQKEAKELGRALAQNSQSELLVHGKNGQIRERSSFGNDPYPPKDKA